MQWLKQECSLDQRGAQQAVEYVLAGKAVLGTVPTQQTIVAERFFDESGGMQLVIHAPFGGRVNRAWGLALRKRFCVTFDFELQAAATDEGIVLSLGERHSFPLETVFAFLNPKTVQRGADAGGAAGADVHDALALERHASLGPVEVRRRQTRGAADSAHAGRGFAGGRLPGCARLPGQFSRGADGTTNTGPSARAGDDPGLPYRSHGSSKA